MTVGLLACALTASGIAAQDTAPSEDRAAGQPERPSERAGERIGERLERFRERRAQAEPVDRTTIEPVFDAMTPPYGERLRQLIWSDGGEGERDAGRAARRVLPRLAELARLQQTDGPAFRVKLREFEAGMAILEAAKAVRDRSVETGEPPDESWPEVGTLRDALRAGHDARLAVRRLELDRLRDRASELEAEIAEAENDRDERVSAQVDRMLDRIARGGDLPPRRDRERSGDD